MSAPRLPRMPWYPNDFAGATRGWPLEARAIYRELLDAQWTLGSLPADVESLKLIAGASNKQWQIAWKLVSQKFAIDADDRLRNPRLEQHRSQSSTAYLNRVEGARKTNAARGRNDND